MTAAELLVLANQLSSLEGELTEYASELNVLNWVIGDAGQFAYDSDIQTAEGAVRRALRKYPVMFKKGAFFSSVVLVCVAEKGSPICLLSEVVALSAFQLITKFSETEIREIQRLSHLNPSETLGKLLGRLKVANTPSSQPKSRPEWARVSFSSGLEEAVLSCPKKPSKPWAKRLSGLAPKPEIRLDQLLLELHRLPPNSSTNDIRYIVGLVSARLLLHSDHRVEIFLILKQMTDHPELVAAASEVLRMAPANASDLLTIAEILPKIPQSRAFLKVIANEFPGESLLQLRIKSVSSTLGIATSGLQVGFPDIVSGGKRPKPECSVREGFPAEFGEEVARNLVKFQSALQTRQRELVEELLATPLKFSPFEFEDFFLSDPARKHLAESLIWTCDDGFMLWQSGAWQTAEGKPVHLNNLTKIALWHPLENGPGTVEVLRDVCVRNEIKQPFKQAFREVYLLTDAERTTIDHSRRFFGHVLRLEQFMALLKAKGWSGTETYAFFGPEEDAAVRKFSEHGISAHFGFRQAPTNFTAFMSDPYLLVTSEAVWFEKDGKAIHLEEVPDHLFSEAMRDVDMFVSVAGIGTDPTWAINDPNAGAGSIWHRMAFGELLPSAQSRADYLRMILPKLGLGASLTVEGKFLHVQGRRFRYKIHLGSSNILIQPNDQYLCIVGVPGGSKTNLVFDGDRTLSLILSKAMMLIADDKIKDPTILSQFPG